MISCDRPGACDFSSFLSRAIFFSLLGTERSLIERREDVNTQTSRDHCDNPRGVC